MRTRFIGLIALMATAITFSPTSQSQTAAQPATANAVPDLSGIWEARAERARTADTALCGIASVCAGLLRITKPDAAAKRDATAKSDAANEKSEEPQMLPWAEEQYKAARVGTSNPNELGKQVLDPNFSGCMPEGPAGMMLDNRRTIEIRQFPDVVFLLFDQDHWVRRIYMDGRQHPAGRPATWMGHSTGRYDGDTLVIDTVGINGKSWTDLQGHPHSDALHLVERIRRVDHGILEAEITIDDPKAYKKPWTKKSVYDLEPPGVEVLVETECEELLEMGTHYSAESKK